MNESNSIKNGERSKAKVFTTIIKSIIVIASVLYFAYYLKGSIGRFPSIDWNVKTALIFSVCFFLYCINMIIAGLNWSLLLNEYGDFLSPFNAIRISLLTQFGKYLPGNVGHHLGRLYMAAKHGVPKFVSLQTIFYETLILTGTGFFVSFLGFLLSKERSFSMRIEIIPILLLLGIILFPFFVPLVNRMRIPLLLKITGGNPLKAPKIYALVFVVFFDLLTFLISGLLLSLIINFAFHVPANDILFLTYVFASSWIIGYLLPGAPAGLGVRDAALATGLGLQFDPGIALATTISFRIIATAGDGFFFLITLVTMKKSET
ncbi:hypothetical protein EHQ53_13545 [Leptospira langatensis]|uniref:Uncharacterized protein n=1 Tax=Leptospira langatensis TaxID=2484983 RepID=A0A5F1ZSX3_9LEPT|nr:lysylphosphatidylglycerol synthase domain-containing protein [Leptospira langatensis]TGK02609.1 hypothetical protein EHO57_04565 [Leptospira langatensis]TGL40189.1 hypothetical protein EHQ53_13545 [Leptospira langatensis]